jgi:Flp pilus assembly pilin Flp
MLRRFFRDRKGQGLVEYALLIAGVALICAAGVSVFGQKTNDLISAVAAILPGAHSEDNAPLISGQLIETAPTPNGPIGLDLPGIVAQSGQPRLGDNCCGFSTNPEGFAGLLVQVQDN